MVDEFGFQPDYWRKMPFVEIQAWQRLALVRRFNRQQRDQARKGV
jgi:myo-inositol catabolism protein IolC